ncbi:MAG: T9SS type A sorting domain-containing protein [Bacteroidetes bacterium]|nr:T9SS type A sorting domain-containing protein [Bacteroidota bacterium]MBU1720462.1 T9SS type A sorting domain-containing protein [Bacteroidota bacterium]
MRNILFSTKLHFVMIWLSAVAFTQILSASNHSPLTLIRSGNAELVLDLTLSAPQFSTVKTKGGTFTKIYSEGLTKCFHAGYPALPKLRQLIEIPYGASCEITVVSESWETIGLNAAGFPNPIAPDQPSVSKQLKPEDVPFVINSEAYTLNEFSPGQITEIENLGEMRGTQIGRLSICPFRYNPVTNTLQYLTNMQLKVTFANADIEATSARKKKYFSPYFSQNFADIINYKEPRERDQLLRSPVTYVIVSAPLFQPELQDFIAWKTKKGFTVIEAYTNDPLVGNTAPSIKAYLQNLYQTATTDNPAPSFILFVGDIQQVPSFAGTTGSHPCDMYFAEYTGDFLPEVYYGRFSATNASELIPQIEKTLEYEQYLMADPSFLNNTVLISGVDGSMAQVWGNGQINYGTTNYFNVAHGFNPYVFLYPGSADSVSQIIQKVSMGASFVNYTAHGSTDCWADPYFGIADVNALQNEGKYPLMIGNACLTNKFDETLCFGEALLRAPKRGAVGYIGGSNSTYWDEDFYWGVGLGTIEEHPVYAGTQLGAYDRTFHENGEPFSQWFMSQDQMVFAGCLAVSESGSSSYDYYWEIYHLMGDPSLMIYYTEPPVMNVSYTPIIPLASTTFTVTAEPFSYAALSMNGVLYGAALADSMGVAEIEITQLLIPGTADVVVTAQNRQPFFGTVNIQNPTGPYIVYKSRAINDASGNGLAEYEETVSLSVMLQNVGISDDTQVEAVLSSTDTLVTITDSTETWPLIAAGDTVTRNNAYSFVVDHFVPDQHNVQFTLVLTDAGSETWTYSFYVKLYSPVLQVGALTVDDASGNGNGNGHPDAGETINVLIKTKNAGHADIMQIAGNLTTGSPLATITSANYSFDTLFAQAAYLNAIFTIDIDAAAPIGSVFALHYEAESGSYFVEKDFELATGIVHEDFETGDFSRYNWNNTGQYPWIVTTANVFEGTYSARSADISDNQESVLQISSNVVAPDSISFQYKVSSEENYDFLTFYVDNTPLGEWSGEIGWTRAAFFVNSGAHVFKWAYAKDYSISDGSDLAWIDYITFPPSTGMLVYANQQAVLDGASIVLYPNPAHSIAFMQILSEGNEKFVITVQNLKGERAMQLSTFSNTMIPLNLENLSSGIYFISAVSDKVYLNEKLIITK